MKIISGGQTGADQGALWAARKLGLMTGGWMPKGYRTLHGPMSRLAEIYGLREHPSSEYPPRTRANAKEADGTLWIGATGSRGYLCTKRAAFGKPFIVNPTVAELRAWVISANITVLNVAGPHESLRGGEAEAAAALLMAAFGRAK